MTHPPPLFTRNFLLVCLALTVFFISNHLLTPSFPVYMQGLDAQKTHPWASWELGTILSSFMVSSLLMRPFVGKFCDEGDPRRWMILGAILFTLMPIAYTASSSTESLLLVRILHGAGLALFYTAASAFMSLEIPASRRAEGMSHYSNAIKVAMAIGPILGVSLAQQQQFNLLFGLAAACGWMSLLLVLFLNPLSPGTPKNQGSKTKTGKLFNGRAVFPGVVMATNSIVFGALIPFVPQLALDKGFPIEVTLFYPIYAISLIFSRALTGPLSDRLGREKVVIPGMAGVCISLVLLGIAFHPSFFLVSAAFYGLCAGTVQPSLMALAADRVPAAERGSAMATFTLFTDLGIASGTFLMATLGYAIGFSNALYAILFVTLSGLVFYGARSASEGDNVFA